MNETIPVNETLADIRERLKDKHTSSQELLDRYSHSDYDSVWKENPSLYAEFANRLIKQAHAAQAVQLIIEREEELNPLRSEGAESVPLDPQLSFLLAMAYARGRSLEGAEARLEPLLEIARGPDGGVPPNWTPKLRVDVIAQRGKIDKFRSEDEPDPIRKTELILSSAAWYDEAMELAERLVLAAAGELPTSLIDYPCINAATMWLLAGEKEKSTQEAAKVVVHLAPTLETSTVLNDYWAAATLGEAYVLTGKHDEAIKWYMIAFQLAEANGELGEIDAMCGNLYRLKEIASTETMKWIEKKVGSLIVFSGHLIDSPRRRLAKLPPRFPDDSDLVKKLKIVIRSKLDDLNASVGFCSLASGSDILFAETMLERSNSELHLVFPFSKVDFLKQSVHFDLPPESLGTDWTARFHTVLSQVKKDNIHFATEEPYLETKLLFDYGNQFMLGLAVLRAKERFIRPIALAVYDQTGESAEGGTKSFLDSWSKLNFHSEPHIIDLSTHRAKHPHQPPLPKNYRLAESIPNKLPRSIRAMLFSDVESYSKLSEEMLPKFIPIYHAVLEEVARETDSLRHFANTWGDGLHAVFNDVAAAAQFATILMSRMAQKINWSEFGFKEKLPLRVALHAGPVFDVKDPFLNGPSCSGRHVNLTARIEPVTMPGCIYASEQFAALLTIEAPDEFRCERVGMQKLPKKTGECVVYRVTRRKSKK